MENVWGADLAVASHRSCCDDEQVGPSAWEVLPLQSLPIFQSYLIPLDGKVLSLLHKGFFFKPFPQYLAD